MKQSIVQLIIFYHVVDLMSFSKAANKLDMSKAYVSRQIMQLEKTMRVKLIERNTRRLGLTFAGEQLFKHSRNIVTEYQHTQQTISTLQDKPEGVLRVIMPRAFTTCLLADKLSNFLAQYPKIDLDMILTMDELGLVEHKVDVAVRLTNNPPEDRIAKLLGYYRMTLVASKDYLKKHGTVKHPKEIKKHHTIAYCTEEIDKGWPFVIDGKEIHVYIKPRLSCNNYEAVLNAVHADCGITRLPTYMVEDDLASGRLEEVCSTFMPDKSPIYAIYAQTIHTPPMVRAFVEFLQNNIQLKT